MTHHHALAFKSMSAHFAASFCRERTKKSRERTFAMGTRQMPPIDSVMSQKPVFQLKGFPRRQRVFP
jgi:hypothetical protein